MSLNLRKYSELFAGFALGSGAKRPACAAGAAGETVSVWGRCAYPPGAAGAPPGGAVGGRLARVRPVVACLLMASGALALGSCSEEEERRPVASTAPSTEASGQPSARQTAEPAPPAHRDGPSRAWLDLGDATAPEVFLATQSVPPGRSASPEMVAELSALLGTADAMFDENRRMVANRTLQLERMLGDISIQESPQALLQGFIAVGRRARRVGYGELCHHYFNLRASGASRQEALAALGVPAGPGAAP